MDANEAVDILLVEDNPQDAELTITGAQEAQPGQPRFTWSRTAPRRWTSSSRRGNYAARELSRPPKVVLLDLKLPKVSGLEVLRALKQDERTRAIPVVVVTSSREDPDIKTAYALGANSYVVKPVDFDAFAEAVSSLGLYWLLVNQPPR